MKIVLPGGNGQVGTVLARAFHRDGHEVTVLTRKTARPTVWRTSQWNLEEVKTWASELEGADVVINLAGRSVNCRHTPANRREIMESRVRSVQAVGRAIEMMKHPPRTWLQMSTAAIYSHRFDEANDELNGTIGGHEANVPASWQFSIDVATAWERALDEIITPSTRKVKIRSSIVMSPDRGGIFDVLLGLVRRGLGGTAGDGRQYVSWVHEADFVRAVYLLIERSDLEGAVNLASPISAPNREFMAILRRAWGTRIGLPAPEWIIKIGSVLLRTEPELVLKSRWVAPKRLLQAGFRFEHPDWQEAAVELCSRWRNQTS